MLAFLINYGGCSQGFGGCALDSKPKERGDERGPTAYGMAFITGIMRAVGVEKWEDLKGKYVRVVADQGHVYKIGHIIENKWFDPKDIEGMVNKDSE